MSMITARNGTRFLSAAIGRSTRSFASVAPAQSHLFMNKQYTMTRSYSTTDAEEKAPVEEENPAQTVEKKEQTKEQQQQQIPKQTEVVKKTEKQEVQDQSQKQEPQKADNAEPPAWTKKTRSGYQLKRMPRVAMFTSGCGYLDGVDIHETVSTIVQLGERDIDITHFTPYGIMENVYNHSTRELDKKEYRVFEKETTRITRKKPINIQAFKVNDFDALVIPGGLVWFRNTSNLEMEHKDLTDFESNEDLNRAIKDFHSLKKPIFTISTGIGAVGIALSKRNGGPGLSNYTIGNEATYSDLLQVLGNPEDNEIDARKVMHDEENNIWSTPGMAGFMNPRVEVVHKCLGIFCDTIFDVIAKIIGKQQQ